MDSTASCLLLLSPAQDRPDPLGALSDPGFGAMS
jgi:hypothetical protein